MAEYTNVVQMVAQMLAQMIAVAYMAAQKDTYMVDANPLAMVTGGTMVGAKPCGGQMVAQMVPHGPGCHRCMSRATWHMV